MKNMLFVSLLLMITVFSCGTYFNQPFDIQEARLGESTEANGALTSLPLPVEPVVVGVYKFRDQTGQYKPTENGSTFSTAISQGTTSILLKALEDSKWFVPIERENLSNLLNERNIIRSTRKEYANGDDLASQKLPPLLYAGIILEGGVISYDSNIITGGLGARYFGAGGSTQYRQDRISVYLRAISTSSGKILKTVYVSKTILSQSVDASLFRYVKFQRLLEAETGLTRNEPVHLAVTEAIEKSVEALIIEGVKDRLWEPQGEEEEISTLVKQYDLEKENAGLTKLYDRLYKEKRSKNAFELAVGASFMNGDFPNPQPEFMGKAGYKRYFSPYFNIGASYSKFNLENKGLFNEGFMSFDVNAECNILPFDDMTPFVYGGFGVNAANYFTSVDPKLQCGLGIEYLVSKNVGVKVFGEQNMVFSDNVDGIINGKRDDFYYRFGVGVNIYLHRHNSQRVKARQKLREEKKNLKAKHKIEVKAIRDENKV
ncbi:CsgG/HfaB family protein [Snuella sedimenti]|uniref:CsgG/HfaB family protein n=1 Tax=Snuella sedimenti TaxID=2798802 RepID=A0A8J7IZM3_9FLAO|nr:CsgG/HfaB family protein [Snuella sedimenti]MBJ6369590.1 CsgG/HfaB family protein [Snuella sedimenti]